MTSRTLVLPPEYRLTLAFAEKVVDTGRAFQSSLKLECGSASFNVRSTLGMISLSRYAEKNALLIAEGEDEAEALEAVAALFG